MEDNARLLDTSDPNVKLVCSHGQPTDIIGAWVGDRFVSHQLFDEYVKGLMQAKLHALTLTARIEGVDYGGT